MGGILRRVFTPYAAGFITAAACTALDTKLASTKPIIRTLAKLGGAVAIAMFGRRYPVASVAAIAAIGASQGSAMAAKALGGMPAATTPKAAMEGLAEMSETYPEMGALLQGGVGALLTGMGDAPNLDANVANYMTAVNNMADDE